MRRTNRRLENVVRYLGRNLLGEDGWARVEHVATSNGRKLDSLTALFDPEAFEKWSHRAAKKGLLSAPEIDELKERLTQPAELVTLGNGENGARECVPASGMPVAISQENVQARGTIADVAEHSFTIWVLNDCDDLDEEEPASVLLLSRSGPYHFSARLQKAEDGTLIVERPARIVRDQKRRFGRYAASLPAIVKPYLGDEQVAEVTIREMSGGGATITNPDGRFDMGNVLELSFTTGRSHYTVAGRVVRTSNAGDLLHIRFEAMKDQERNEIARSLALA
jgi:hypothetical protein